MYRGMRKRRRKGVGIPGKKAKSPDPVNSPEEISETEQNGIVNDNNKADQVDISNETPEKDAAADKTLDIDEICMNSQYKGYVSDVAKFLNKPENPPMLADAITMPRSESNLEHCDKPNFLHNLGKITINKCWFIIICFRFCRPVHPKRR